MNRTDGLVSQLAVALWLLSRNGSIPALDQLLGSMQPEASIRTLESWVGAKLAYPDELFARLVLDYLRQCLASLGRGADEAN